MKGLWDYTEVTSPAPYGKDEVTYRKAMDYLGDCEGVEDWGCGTAFAKQFCKAKAYIGIDGSRSRFADFVVDLREYRSNVDGILMRHILEHNTDWQVILGNAVASFRRRAALVIFTPFQPVTAVLDVNDKGVPDIGFQKNDLTQHFTEYLCAEETLETRTYYGQEHIFYLQR